MRSLILTILPALGLSQSSTSDPLNYIQMAKALEESYHISFVPGSIVIGFNDASSTGEILFQLNVTEAQKGDLMPLNVYDYETCKTIPYSADILDLSYDSSNPTIENGFATFDIQADVKTNKLQEYLGSIYFEDPAIPDETKIKFCVLAEVGSVIMEGNVSESSVSYVKIKFELTVKMSQGFESATITVIEEHPSEMSESTNAQYNLYSCECNPNTKQCDETITQKTQNSALNICVITGSPDVVIGDIKSMLLSQGAIQMNAIDNYETNSITSKSGGGTQREVVITRLVSVFFTEPSPVTVSGTALLAFAQSNRKLVHVNQGIRQAQTVEAEDQLLGSFSLQVQVVTSRLNDGNEPESLKSDSNMLSCIMSTLILLVGMSLFETLL